MNNEEKNNLCPKCGNKLTANSNCLRCGYFDVQQNAELQDIIKKNDIEYEHQIKKAKSYLRVSILNIIFFLPIACIFGLHESILGFTSGSVQKSFGGIIFISIYGLCSICFLIWSIINLRK